MKLSRTRVRELAHHSCARSVFYSLLALQAIACGGQTIDEEVTAGSQSLVDTSICSAGANIVLGTEGDDHLVGTNKNDCILGLGGNDVIEGGNGEDWLFGGNGDDQLSGDNGSDHLDGGQGKDELQGGNANDDLDGGDGDDNLAGDNGEDNLRGGQGNDSIAGGNGEDVLQGGEGHDLLSGDNGSDILQGDAGSDTLMGGDGADWLTGGEGDDILIGENGADTVHGEQGNDILIGGNGTDSLVGGVGNDVIVGGRSNDQVEGGDGLDVCDQACCEAIVPEQPRCYTNAECPSGQYCVPEAGLCLSCSADAACADATSCTTDACQPALGCIHLPVLNGTACDDGNACMQTDTCVDGACSGTNPVQCAAQDQCHVVGICDPATGACSNPPSVDGTGCNDGNACTQTDACVAGSCNGSNPVVCTAQDQCHDPGTCDPTNGVCSNPSSVDGTSCNDGDACSISDVCGAGVCAGAPLDCDDQNSCSDDSCHGGTCQHVGNGSCLVPKTFTEAGGLVIIEAENFNLNTPRSNHSWDTTEDPLASGGSMMRAVPNTGTLLNEDVLSSCPQLDFNVQFTTTGKYYVWVRGKADTTNDDTCHVGIDGKTGTGTSRIFVSGTAYAWGRTNTSNAIASVTVTTAGMHTLNFWMREDGFKFDRILLTTDASYTPTGLGPAPTTVAGCDGMDSKFPGNPEICDGLDQDCDGAADFPGETADADRDGFLACAECDDSDARRFPGNPEVCDGRDNDCDGVASFPNEATDADQDGSPACADCNEYDPHNFPGNRELCDGRDNDCSGLADADPAGEVDADNDSLLSCIDCNDHDTNNSAQVTFLVHGPAAEAATAASQIRLLATQPLGTVWLAAAAPLTWATQVTLPHHSNITYLYTRNDSTDSTEVGPWGESLASRSLKVECADLKVEDAIWNWDDFTTTGSPAPLSKGPTVSTVSDASNQITISVDLNTPPDAPLDATLHYSTMSNDYPPENVMLGSGNSRYEFGLTGLQPGTTYYYYVEYGSQITSEYRFTTSSGSDQRFRFVAYGDSQDQSGTAVHRNIVSQAYSYHPAVVIRTGDLVEQGTDLSRWQSFFAIERPLLSSAIYLPVQGNHESMTKANSNFVNLFALPPTPASEQYYAVRYNNTLFLGLSTELTVAETQIQTSWLSSTLTDASNDPSIRWKVAYFHKPPYSKGEHGSDATVRSNWHPLFKDNGVNLVFSGHDHDYERAVVDGIQYLVIGGAGSDLRPVGSDPARTKYSESVFHWVAVEVDGPQLTANTYRVDGSRMDGFTLSAPTP